MVRLDGGQFLMGEQPPSLSAPVRRVQIAPFLIGMTEVTWLEYMYFMEELPAGDIWFRNREKSPRMPAYNVSWLQAAKFCNRLSQMKGLRPYYQIIGEGREATINVTYPAGDGYRLPTEAEWEYACRANNGGDFCCPPAQLPDHAWTQANAEGRLRITGLKDPNAFGLYDMHGNVAEWCDDWFGSYVPAPAERVLENPRVQIPPDTTRPYKVYRGGSVMRPDRDCRSAWRMSASIDFKNPLLGFRVARSSGFTQR
jgi:formylglycine-generating enzyme required for sulfatase activity